MIRTVACSVGVQERCRPWFFQAPAGSYQFAVAIQEPRQGKLFGDDLPDPSTLTPPSWRFFERRARTRPEL